MSLAAFALAGCGDDEKASTSQTPAPTASPTATATPASPEDQPGGAGDETPIVHRAELTIGSEGFEPPVLRVPAFFQISLTIDNETARPQTVDVEGSETFTVPAGGAGGGDLGTLQPGRHRVRLAGTPFEATLIAEEGGSR